MTGIVIGNLAVDVRGCISATQNIATFAVGHDVSITADSVVTTAGGSGLLFAQTLISRGAKIPLLFGCVGNDGAGELLLRQLEDDNIPTIGIDRTDLAPTSTVMLTYLPDGTRLLIRPRTQANMYLSPALVDRVLEEAEVGYYEFVWLSGYALVDPDSDRMRAVKAVCEWARAKQIKIFVDLVPHAFRKSVGNFEYVLDQLGEIDGVVAELETYCDLKYCMAEALLSTAQRACEDSVRNMSRVVTYAVAQHRINATNYVQVLGASGAVVNVSTYLIEGSDLRGMGDLMSVDALRFLKVLT